MLVELTLSDRSHAPNVLPMSDFFKRRPTTAARAGRGRGCHDRRLASSRPARAHTPVPAGHDYFEFGLIDRVFLAGVQLGHGGRKVTVSEIPCNGRAE